MYITRLASNEKFSPSNKIHREVGRAKDLSAPRYWNKLKVNSASSWFLLYGYLDEFNANATRTNTHTCYAFSMLMHDHHHHTHTMEQQKCAAVLYS